MAFPTGYLKYQEVTIDNTKVSADLTDFVIYVDLSDLSKAGADIFDSCRSDGGDIRVTKSDGTTELAREIVSIDTTGKTGELHVKFTGTLSSSSDTVIRIWYNGTDTEPAVTATYGRDNVWSDYEAVWHMEEDPSGSAPQIVDATGNGNDLTSAGSMTSGDNVSGALAGNAIDFDGTDDYLTTASSANLRPATSDFTFSAWVKPNAAVGSGRQPVMFQGDVSDEWWVMEYDISAGQKAGMGLDDGSQFDHLRGADISTTYTQGGFNHWVAVRDYSTGMEYYQAGTSVGSNTKTQGTINDTTNAFFIAFGTSGLGNPYTQATIDEVRIRKEVLASSWVATEHDNQDSPSTFYSVGDEQGGSTIVSPSAQALSFTLPAESIVAGSVLEVGAQVLSFSIPAYGVTGAALVSVNAQTASFSIPAYAIVAAGIVLSPDAQVVTLSLPTEQIITGAVLGVNTQTLTLELPANTVTGAAQIQVDPAVLTLEIPTLDFVGAIWGRTARETTGADWSRSAINNDA